jgi:hypothetical protein
MKVDVWTDGIINWDGRDNMKEFTTEELNELNKLNREVPGTVRVAQSGTRELPIMDEWTYATQVPSPDNLETENAGDLITALELQARTFSDELYDRKSPVVQSYHEEPNLDDSDLPVIYEAYAFPTPNHRTLFLLECIEKEFIAGGAWDPESLSTEEGSKAVVLIAEKGIDKVGTVAKSFHGKEVI